MLVEETYPPQDWAARASAVQMCIRDREYTALPADTAQAMQALAARAGIRTDGGTEETARQVAQYIGSAAQYLSLIHI